MIMFNSGIKMMYVSMLGTCNNSLVLCYCFRLCTQGTGYKVQGTGTRYRVQGRGYRAQGSR